VAEALASTCASSAALEGHDTGKGLGTIGGKFLAQGGGRGGILNCGLGKGSEAASAREA
jgi:hypothetical protein